MSCEGKESLKQEFLDNDVKQSKTIGDSFPIHSQTDNLTASAMNYPAEEDGAVEFSDSVRILHSPTKDGGNFGNEDSRRKDHHFLSSTTSHVSFGFGSLDIIMEKDSATKERISSILENDPYDRPQKWGWAVVIASWLILIPIVGVLSSFGTIVSPLTKEFNSTKFEAGWIGSLAFSFTVGTCTFSTPLFNIFGARKVASVGIAGATGSLIVTSFAPVFYMFFFTYSFLFGVFSNFVYNSAMNLTGQYFPFKHQALATCLASAGVSFGTLLVNPLSKVLVESYGWRNSLRIQSGGIFVIGLLCVAVFRPVKTRDQILREQLRHIKAKKADKDETMEESLVKEKRTSNDQTDLNPVSESGQYLNTASRLSLAAKEIKHAVLNKKAFDCSVCSNFAFILWMLGTLLWSISFLFPFIFLIDYLGTIGISGTSAALVMTVYGIAEFVGRAICAAGAGKLQFSLAYVYTVTTLFVGLATIIAPFAASLLVMHIYAACAGVCSGILNSLMYVATMQFFGNDTGAHVWGYINFMLATGMVIGPVAAGGIFDATQSYEAAFYMGGSVFILCGIFMAFIPLALSRHAKAEAKAKQVREKKVIFPVNSSSKIPMAKSGAMRRLAHQQSALRAKANKDKWNGDVESHLRELYQIEEDLKNGKELIDSKTRLPEISRPTNDSDLDGDSVTTSLPTVPDPNDNLA